MLKRSVHTSSTPNVNELETGKQDDMQGKQRSHAHELGGSTIGSNSLAKVAERLCGCDAHLLL